MAKVMTVMKAFSLMPLAITRADELTLPIRVESIRLDSSRCIAFTQILNHDDNTENLASVKVVAAFGGDNPHFSLWLLCWRQDFLVRTSLLQKRWALFSSRSSMPSLLTVGTKARPIFANCYSPATAVFTLNSYCYPQDCCC